MTYFIFSIIIIVALFLSIKIYLDFKETNRRRKARERNLKKAAKLIDSPSTYFELQTKLSKINQPRIDADTISLKSPSINYDDSNTSLRSSKSDSYSSSDHGLSSSFSSSSYDPSPSYDSSSSFSGGSDSGGGSSDSF